MTRPVFVHGPLVDEDLLRVVCGASVSGDAATLPGLGLRSVDGQPFALLDAAPDANARGRVLSRMDDEARARLDFYASVFGMARQPHQSADGPVEIYVAPARMWAPGGPWEHAAWVAQHRAIDIAAAQEIMERRGVSAPDALRALYPFLRARAHSRQMGEATVRPTQVRRETRVGDIDIVSHTSGHEGFFRLKTFEMRQRRFDGSFGPTLSREAFVAFDAALVLPYDPARDLVLMIEQLRFAPLWRGDPQPYMLEPVAGLVDAGEDPAEAARREAREEAGVVLEEIIPLITGYPAPGYVTEYHHCYLGLCALDPGMAGLGGLASESEDIRSHVVSFSSAMALIDTGEITATPLALMLLLLARQRDALRARS